LGIASKLAAFSEETISRYMCWEKPETAGWWDQFCEERPEKLSTAVRQLKAADDLNPQKRRYKTIGELYHLIESAFTSIPEDVLFIGPQKAQITNSLIPFVPPLVPVLARESACQAIDLIIREGEGLPSGPTTDCHFTYFTQIHKELQAEQAREPQFQPAWPVIENPLYDFHRDSAMPEANIITDSSTRQVGEIFTATYDLMIQILMRLFSNNGETEEQLKTLATASMEMMTSCLRPVGVMLTRMPAGYQYPHKAAGPSFEIYSDTQPLPHLRSAWTYFHERMREIADQCQNLGQNPNMPQGLKRVAIVQQAMVDQFIL
jgi:Ferritin-like